MKLIFAFLATFFLWAACPSAVAAGAVSTVMYNAYATTNATTAAYTTFIVSTLSPTSTFFVCDTSGKFIKLAVGAAGAEVDISGAPVSGCAEIETGKIVPQGSRISFRALDANATTGGIMLSLSR